MDKENKKSKIISIILMAIPFLIMSFSTRLIMSDKAVYTYKPLVFILVTIANLAYDFIFIFLILILSFCINKLVGRIIYIVSFVFFYIMFLCNIIYYNTTGYAFSMYLTKLAGEGSSYVAGVVLSVKWYIFAVAVFAFAAFAFVVLKVKWESKLNVKNILFSVGIFIVFHFLIPNIYGPHIYNMSLEEWHIPRNVYDNFNDANKAIKVCGLYEYVVRDVYVSFFRKEEKPTDEIITKLDSIYNNEELNTKNEYSGIFEGMNVIFLQLEGIDSWLLDEETMPNLYRLKEEGLNFNNHYSYYSGAGSTFNSEFAVNTGFITPISFYKNPTFFYTNTFKDTLPMIFDENGYGVNAFHMNTSEFYNRGLNYDSWGYDNYYSLMDMEDYDDLSYELDTELINNKTFYDLIFKKDKPFLHYMITYTPHTPFSTKEDVGKFLGEKVYGKGNVPDLSEEESVRLMAKETDDFIGLLIKGLKDNNLYDNTVIVAYADHYLYLMDEDVLKKYKDTSNNLVNNTPFIIWSSDIMHQDIDTVNSQLDILPTVLNMFGVDYKVNSYIGRDIFADGLKYVFFDDLSWYDGESYVENGTVTSGKSMDEVTLNEINKEIHGKVEQNDLTLKYDYFRGISNE